MKSSSLQALSDAKELLADAEDSLEELEAMCVKGEETWEDAKQNCRHLSTCFACVTLA